MKISTFAKFMITLVIISILIGFLTEYYTNFWKGEFYVNANILTTIMYGVVWPILLIGAAYFAFRALYGKKKIEF